MSIDFTELFRKADDSLYLTVKLTPKASDNRLGTIQADVDGKLFLKAMVTTVPEAGKANAALINLLSKRWKIPKGKITIASGATNRNKHICILLDDSTIEDKLRLWIRKHQP